jgi:hypothetical protein
MRFLVSIVALMLVFAGSLSAFGALAQEQSLLDLLPTAGEVGPGFAVVDNRARSLDEQATGFSDAGEASRLLGEWGWQENAFLVFQATEQTAEGAPSATIDISLTRFASAEDAARAMPFFLEDRAAVLGQQEVPDPAASPIGDEVRAVGGVLDDGSYDFTIFARSGPLLMRVSATAAAGSPHASPEQIARGIVDRAAGLLQPAATTLSLTDILPQSLPLGESACVWSEAEDDLDIPAFLEQYDGVPDAAATLQAMGWQEGAYRQFACDNPRPGGVGWVNVAVHRFADAEAAAEAVAFFADSRAQVTRLQATPAGELGAQTAALAGPTVNGTEYSLYLSDGPFLYRVTGVAPAGDPRPDVEMIAMALAERSTLAPGDLLLTPTPQAVTDAVPTIAPAPTSQIVLATIPAPTQAPAPTIAPQPSPTPVLIATSAPALIPVVVPTAVPTLPPTPSPTAVPTTAPAPTTAAPLPTAPTGAAPTPTPRVIHPPTQTGEG